MSGNRVSELWEFIALNYPREVIERGDITLVPYAFKAQFGALASGATLTSNINIIANADFVLTDIRYQALADLNPATSGLSPDVLAPYIDLLITDGGSQEQLMQEAQPLASFASHLSTEQSVYPYPRIIGGRSSLIVQVTNVSNVLANPQPYVRTVITFAGALVRGYSKG